jgi:hypothetical protein
MKLLDLEPFRWGHSYREWSILSGVGSKAYQAPFRWVYPIDCVSFQENCAWTSSGPGYFGQVVLFGEQ